MGKNISNYVIKLKLYLSELLIESFHLKMMISMSAVIHVKKGWDFNYKAKLWPEYNCEMEA